MKTSKDIVANELATQMKINMRPHFSTQEEKFTSVLSHLNSAAEYFDEAGNDKFADLVTNFMVKLAQG